MYKIFLIFSLYLFITFIQPIWQIYDDIYYAMLIDGYGIVNNSINDVPFFHPIYVKILIFLKNYGITNSYANSLIFGSFLGYAVLLLNSKNYQEKYLLYLFIGVIPVILYLQYSTVAGLLAVCGIWCLCNSLNIHSSIQKKYINIFLSLILIIWSGLLRIKILGLAFLIMLPIILYFNIKIKYKIIVMSTVFVIIGVLQILQNNMLSSELKTFYENHKIRTVFLDYSLINSPLIKNNESEIYSKYELNLFKNWFMLEQSIIDNNRLNSLYEEITLYDKIVAISSNLIKYIISLKNTIYFWIILACYFIFWKNHTDIKYSLLIFISIILFFTVLGRPPPERICLGIISGLWCIGVLSRINKKKNISNSFVTYTILTIIISNIFLKWYNVNNFPDVNTSFWPKNKIVYISNLNFPIREIFQPFNNIKNLNFIPITTMYNHNAVKLLEIEKFENTFMECLKIPGCERSVFFPNELILNLKYYLHEKYKLKLIIEKDFDFYGYTAIKLYTEK